MMKVAGLVLSMCLGLGTVANAGTIYCAGKYQGKYEFIMTATIDDMNRVQGLVRFEVKAGLFNKVMDLPVTSSDIRPNEYIKATAEKDGDGGTLDAVYNPATTKYDGTLDAKTTLGNGIVPVKCTLTADAPAAPFEQIHAWILE